MLSHSEEYRSQIRNSGHHIEELWRQCQQLRANNGQLEDRCELLRIEGEKLRSTLVDYLRELKAVQDASLRASHTHVTSQRVVTKLF